MNFFYLASFKSDTLTYKLSDKNDQIHYLFKDKNILSELDKKQPIYSFQVDNFNSELAEYLA